MANFQVTIYFNNEGDLTQSLVLDVIANDEDEAIELVEEEAQDYIDDYGIPYKYKVTGRMSNSQYKEMSYETL